MTTLTLPDATGLPALGLGTWHLGESNLKRAEEVASLRLALEIGYRVIDTAEMYGDGGAEEVLGSALTGAFRAGSLNRDQVFIVSKVMPQNATPQGVAAACERSLRRLALDHIDLYLLHWPGPHPLAGTVGAFEELRADGLIRHWGVSNFDTHELAALDGLPGGPRCAANQVYYSLSTRGPEIDLLPWQRRRSIPLMAYCPLDQGDLAVDAVLMQVASKWNATPSQVALAWLMAQPGVMPIPKALREVHLHENFASAALHLDAADMALIAQRFPAPIRKQPLAMR